MIAIGHHDTIKITRQRISNFASAFEAEALALNEALKLSGQLPETYSTVKIYTDSKSSLQSLLNERRTSSVLAENQILAHQLGSSINLHLQWVPGHRNIEGNEWADRIANLQSSVTIASGPQKFRKAFSRAKLTSGFPRFGSRNGFLPPPTPRYEFFSHHFHRWNSLAIHPLAKSFK